MAFLLGTATINGSQCQKTASYLEWGVRWLVLDQTNRRTHQRKNLLDCNYEWSSSFSEAGRRLVPDLRNLS